MSYLKIGGFVAAALALAGALWWIVATIDKAGQVDAFRACTKAAKSATAPLDACDTTIAGLVGEARRAALCETALAPAAQGGGRDLYLIRATCGEQIKRIDAELGVTAANLADAQAQIAAAGADRDQAIARAEARALSTADRKAANDHIIDTAPRGGDGRIHCDALCLRSLAGS